jgi:hypothetical protein
MRFTVNIPAIFVSTFFLITLTAPPVAAQAPDASRPLGRFTFQAAAGPLIKSGGHTVSAGVGFSPISRIDLAVNVARDHIPFRREVTSDSSSMTRGGTLAYVSGEIRASIMPPHRVSPYVFGGIGAGVSQPNVNSNFPIAVENKLRVVYAGAGLRIPISRGLSIFGDGRVMLGMEDNDGLLGMWPVRAGLTWRF